MSKKTWPTEQDLRARSKKCPVCSEVKGGDRYYIQKRGDGYLCLYSRCKECHLAWMQARKESDHAYASAQAAQSKAAWAGYAKNGTGIYGEQSASLEGASNNRKEWTGPELELVMRKDLAPATIASMLNRTVYSVRVMRFRARNDPRKRDLAGIAQMDPA